MQMHLFTSSTLITTAEKANRWREALDISTWMPRKDLELDAISTSSVISHWAQLADLAIHPVGFDLLPS